MGAPTTIYAQYASQRTTVLMMAPTSSRLSTQQAKAYARAKAIAMVKAKVGARGSLGAMASSSAVAFLGMQASNSVVPAKDASLLQLGIPHIAARVAAVLVEPMGG